MSKNEFLRGKPKDAGGEQMLSLCLLLTAVLIITAGFFIGTQSYCRGVNYNEFWCGKPELILRFGQTNYPVYNPFSLLWWMLEHIKRPEIHPYLIKGLKTAGGFSLASIVFYFMTDTIIIKNRNRKLLGSARWGRVEDLRRAGLLGYKGGVVLGQSAGARVEAVVDKKEMKLVMRQRGGARKIVEANRENVALIAPTRTGKGISSVIPTLLSYPGSCIVLDFKGECFAETSGWRAKFGKVYRWSPLGESGHRYNPLDEVKTDERAYGDANLIADILTTPEKDAAGGSSEHFRLAAKEFLTAILLYVVFSAGAEKTLAGAKNFLSLTNPKDPEDSGYICRKMIKTKYGNAAVERIINEIAGIQLKRPYEEAGSVLSTISNALGVFADPVVARNTQESEFYIDEYIETKDPITLYITIPYGEIKRVSPLIRMFVTLFSRRFTAGETRAADVRLKTPLLFVLDEFDKLGRMEELHLNMGIHNGFGIHYFLVMQSINQLTATYGKSHSFLANCKDVLFFQPGPGDIESAELISKICGKEGISRISMSYSGKRASMGFSGKSVSEQAQDRNLINADEVMKLPADSLIILSRGCPPYIAKKNVYYDDPAFTGRLRPPAWETREEAVELARGTVEKIKRRRQDGAGAEKTEETTEENNPKRTGSEEKNGAWPDGGYAGALRGEG